MVAADGFVRLPDRSWDRYGAEILTPATRSAATASDPVYGPRPGGYTVSNSRLRRAANVVIAVTSPWSLVKVPTRAAFTPLISAMAHIEVIHDAFTRNMNL